MSDDKSKDDSSATVDLVSPRMKLVGFWVATVAGVLAILHFVLYWKIFQVASGVVASNKTIALAIVGSVVMYCAAFFGFRLWDRLESLKLKFIMLAVYWGLHTSLSGVGTVVPVLEGGAALRSMGDTFALLALMFVASEALRAKFLASAQFEIVKTMSHMMKRLIMPIRLSSQEQQPDQKAQVGKN